MLNKEWRLVRVFENRQKCLITNKNKDCYQVKIGCVTLALKQKIVPANIDKLKNETYLNNFQTLWWRQKDR